MMKYIYINLLFIFLCHTSCFAQKALIFVSGNILYTSESSIRFSNSIRFMTPVIINDTVAVFQISKRLTNIYTPNIGYEVVSRVKFRMGKRFKFSTGIGLHYLNFKVKTINEITVGSHTNPDGLNYATMKPFNTICDRFDLFPSSKPNEIRLDGNFNILSAKSPFELSYSFLDEKLELGIGLFLQVPIYSRSKSNHANHTNREVDGILVCESEFHEEVENDISGLSETQIGSIFNLSYKLTDKFFVDFGLVDYVVGVFKGSAAFENSQDRYTPTSVYLGIKFKL